VGRPVANALLKAALPTVSPDTSMTLQFSRRGLLDAAASVAGLAFIPPAWARGTAARFPNSRALAALIAPSIKMLGGAAHVERLGQSQGGRPIELVTIGSGPRSALIVGAPHPNEPIGCLTVVRLIERLATDRAFRESAGFTWHFIPAIDVDGLDLNAGWFSGPLTLDRYFRHFFRPAFSAQPEYGFPLDMPGYRFNAPTPENVCWQRAVEIARPDFQSSLHGNDSGGAFYLLSRNRPKLASALSQQPGRFGIALNDLGEPDSDLDHYAPGVFSFFEVGPWLQKRQRSGEAASDNWNAGRSSAEFAAERFGTLSVTCEVPLWRDQRQTMRGPSPYTLRDVLRMQLEQTDETLRLLDGATGLLEIRGSSLETTALVLALREAVASLPRQKRAIEAQIKEQNGGTPVSLADLVQLEPGTTAMRVPAMLARLARLTRQEKIALAAETVLRGRIDAFRVATSLTPIPSETTTALQARAVVTAMASLE